MGIKFNSTFHYKLIYVFRINEKSHEGLLKIGDATIHTDNHYNSLFNSCSELNKAAKERINSYTNTAGISYELLHTEIAVVSNKGSVKAFRDYQVHEVLKKSGIKQFFFDTEKKQNEWFKTDLETVKNAITALKNGRNSLLQTEISSDKNPIAFRPEQKEAIEKTISKFYSGNRMLWNAKMRFGKTLAALEVVKRMAFQKTLIFTHRPVVSDGWFEDFGKIFYDSSEYLFGSKQEGKGLSLNELETLKLPYVYFASIQDLRGSSQVGGIYDKNDIVFDLNWDFVIIDEAHEGTQTELGINVISSVVKKNTKLLNLSGTPFNLLSSYEGDEIYTWDYVMEQRAKNNWYINNYGDSNPYEELPELNIYTYHLDKLMPEYLDLEDKAFNFKEFFRTWVGEIKEDRKPLPSGKNIGDFVHEDDVVSFLNLISKEDSISNYPFSNEEYRSYFRHSLWMVPGVKEAKALSNLMRKHKIFGSGLFSIVNVAGEGDEETPYQDALKSVRHAIGKHPEKTYSVTLSCGRLTTGVSVPEWTAVFMLSGSYSTSASSYLQTIFRVQTPANIAGKIKEKCYVFDFAPDRTLKMVAEASKISAKAGQTTSSDRQIMGDFLNYCPVISVDGTKMQPYDVDGMLQQLKRAYTDRVVKNGFDDNHIYNDSLLQLDGLEISEFANLGKIIGSSKQSKKVNEIEVNDQGFTNEEYEEIQKIQKKPKRELTEEEKEKLKEIKEKNKNRLNAISILRGISIRIPLIVYGVDIPFDKEITVDNFTEIIDNSSWEEFMPRGVTKEMFKKFSRYYDSDIFVGAGRQIRNLTKSADNLSPSDRVKKITSIFTSFKNPDKETVLTPWRVVNMHIGDCLGGYNFLDNEQTQFLEEPRYIDYGDISNRTVGNVNSKVLEINSKTGLYPLYITYSIFQKRCSLIDSKLLDIDTERNLWDETVRNNIFVICKTPMAKNITKRTLVGYSNSKVNLHHFEDLINQITHKSDKFIKKITNGETYWKNSIDKEMKFDAIIGNPPYQIMDDGHGVSAKPVYDKFVEIAKRINPKYLSMIMPSRWFAGGKGLDDFRERMLNDRRTRLLVDYENSNDIFPGVDVAGGICYFLWEDDYDGLCKVTNLINNQRIITERALNEHPVFVRHQKSSEIINKVKSFKENNGKTLSEMVSSRKPFGLATNYKSHEAGIPCWFLQKIGLSFANASDVTDTFNLLDKWKLLIPAAPIAGQTDFSKPVGFYYEGNVRIAKPGECCTETWLVACAFDTLDEVISFKSYLFTKVVRFLLLQGVISQHVTKQNFLFVPDVGDYSRNYDDNYLIERWAITEDEWEFINSRIK